MKAGGTRWNPRTGELLQTIRLPVAQVTSCLFGGPDLDTLFLTSARRAHRSAAGRATAGRRSFRVTPGVRGLPVSRNKGEGRLVWRPLGAWRADRVSAGPWVRR